MPSLQCPICDKAVSYDRLEEVPWRPFCSRRCKMVDLGRWLDGTYNLPEPLPAADPAIDVPKPRPERS